MRLILATIFIFLTFWSAEGSAQSCSLNVDGINFSNVNGQPTSQIVSSGNISGYCFGGGLGNTVRFCISAPEGSGGLTLANRRMTNGGNFLSYNLYKDASLTQIWGERNAAQTPITLDVTLNGFLTFFSTPYYAAIAAGQTGKPVGAYTSNFTNGGNRIVVRLGNTSSNCSTLGSQPYFFTMTVQAQVAASCVIQANNLNFGTAGKLDNNIDSASSILVTCPNGVPYTLSLNGGDISGDINSRQMAQGGAGPGVINYQLYTNSARTQIFGNGVNGSQVTGTGTGTAQSITVYGRVPAQASVPQNIYSDTITATLDY